MAALACGAPRALGRPGLPLRAGLNPSFESLKVPLSPLYGHIFLRRHAALAGVGINPHAISGCPYRT